MPRIELSGPAPNRTGVKKQKQGQGHGVADLGLGVAEKQQGQA